MNDLDAFGGAITVVTVAPPIGEGAPFVEDLSGSPNGSTVPDCV
ncbi:MAG: hypothetical protein ACKV2O_21550 [Acidimicrobiales bacterium]